MSEKLPIDLKAVRSHVTKEEYLERKATELPVLDSTIIIPASLKRKKLREKFVLLAGYLDDLGVWSIADTDELKRYVEADALCEDLTQKMNAALHWRDYDLAEQIDRMRGKAVNQAHTLANSLGLNIIARAKIQRPVKEKDDGEEIKM